MKCTNQTRTPLKCAIPVMQLRNQQSQQSLTANMQANKPPPIIRVEDKISALAHVKTGFGHNRNLGSNFDKQKIENEKLATLRQLPIQSVNDSQHLSVASWFIDIKDNLELSFE
ncbi:Hypothetical_protein [Hexamita inflata]|uniref:Hypothetical_protein n=1 Tax=Hexamita inflata TaxID=28002 RepID=A0AA86R0Z3_9EUKA|nr:Hypothetical protein HINF_LOCUS51144 [Hexamita inflata]